MAHQHLVLYEKDLRQMADACQRLVAQANAKAVLLVDKNGQFITSQGDVQHLDMTSLASLTAGNMAATSALARLIGEDDFPNVFHEGQTDSLHLSVVGQRAILVVMFDKRSSLGLVRLRAKKCLDELTGMFTSAVSGAGAPENGSPFESMTDRDIDNLFGD